jgi:PIN like domain
VRNELDYVIGLFSIVAQVGRMHELVPLHVKFVIQSGDKGYEQLEQECVVLRRSTLELNPHLLTDELLHSTLQIVNS